MVLLEAVLRGAAIFLITIYISLPVIVFLCPWIVGYIIFSHLWRLPLFADLSRPEDVLDHTCNFYLSPEEGVSVGVWHTLPASQWEEAAGRRSPEWYRETLGDGRPVIVYLHGKEGTRAERDRVELVKILSAAGHHVLSFDYRGFGDSTGEPSEAGLTTDALCLYQWAKTHSRGLVCLWGHSLGTGVATNTAVKVQQQGSVVDAVVLEAPYTRIGEVILIHPLTKMYMFIPGFRSFILHILELNNIVFANDRNLKVLRSPLLVLHAEDDDAVPHHMGLQLYQISLQTKKDHDSDVRVEMISFGANLGLSHSRIYLDPNLPTVVGKFLQNLRQ